MAEGSFRVVSLSDTVPGLYGKLEIVSDLERADTLIVIAPGADTLVFEFPMLASDGSRAIERVFSQATSYLVVKDAGRLKVLWAKVASIFRKPNSTVASRTIDMVTADIEKRMKARAGNSKK